MSTEPPTAGRRQRLWGIALIVLGVVGGGILTTLAFLPLLGEEPTRVEGPTTIVADAGDELAIYRVAGSAGGVCGVIGPDGQDLAIERPFGTETLTLGGTSYLVDRVMTAQVTGEQVVSCDGGAFAVGPRIGVFGLVGRALLGIFGGLAAIVTGIVLLVVGSRRNRPPQPPFGQYPGQPYPGQQYPGQPYPGQPNQGQPYPGQPNQGQPYPGQQYPGQPYPGPPNQGQPHPGQPHPGQPYPGQQSPGQPYPGQPGPSI